MKFPIALASAAMAASLAAAPMAQAADKGAPTQTAVFLGGTGTGYVPSGPTAPAQFVTPFVSGPYKGINHVYNGSPVATPQESAGDLLARIASEQAQGQRVTVIGLSKGAQVSMAAMHAPNAPTGVDYVLIGNPDRDGGANTAAGLRPKYGETKANVRDVYGEYDGFADVPDRPNPLAVANAAMGIFYVHLQYGTGKGDDPLKNLDKATTTVRDNLDADGKPNGTTTTEVRIPTKYLPLLRPVRDTLKTWHQSTAGLDKYEASIRPVIDSGYSRNDKPKETTPETPAKAPAAKPVKRPNPLANLFKPPVKATPKPKAATAAKATTNTTKENHDNG